MARGSGELLDRLGKSPPQVKAAVLLGAAVVLGGIYYYLFYSDLSDERVALSTQRKKLADDERKLQQRKKEYADLLQRKLEVEEELKKNAVKLPSSSELPAFFVHLQTQANAANIRTTDWARKSESPVESYVKVPVEVEVEGDFYQLLQYFKLLSETPRIITVENLQIHRPDKKTGDGSTLTARFMASTFRQADLPPATIEEKKPAKKDAQKGAAGAPEASPKPGEKAPEPKTPPPGGAPAAGGKQP